MHRDFALKVILPRNSWQCLIAMAAEDLREPAEFLHWLLYLEAKRRGLLTPVNSVEHDTVDSLGSEISSCRARRRAVGIKQSGQPSHPEGDSITGDIDAE